MGDKVSDPCTTRDKIIILGISVFTLLDRKQEVEAGRNGWQHFLNVTCS
jgi:hypothetical protein